MIWFGFLMEGDFLVGLAGSKTRPPKPIEGVGATGWPPYLR
jgi:hypothetical protein